MKIFFYGGTFDPPHNGHKLIVDYCLNKCDKIVLVPNRKSPHKKLVPFASEKHRKQMLNILFNNKKIEICNFEFESFSENYTYLTIKHLKKKYENFDLTMIIGFDQLLNLKKWKNIDFILNNVRIICFNRKLSKNKFLDKTLFNNIEFVEDFKIMVSSSKIRENLKNKSFENITSMLNSKIIKYIKENNLYA